MEMSATQRLCGAIDMHVHSSPDVVPRRLNDIEIACAAAQAGMSAVVLKNHVGDTSARAAVAQSLVGQPIRVFGGVVLNRPVGGVNPAAVDVCQRLGGKVVWMPTLDAGTFRLLDEQGSWIAPIGDILAQVREAGAILATGHVEPRVAVALCRLARSAKVRVVFTHPEWPGTRLPIAEQRELAAIGVVFERTAVSLYESGGRVDLGYIAREIKEVGASSTILSSDLGQPENPEPVAGLAHFADALARAGVSPPELELMLRQNQCALLDLACEGVGAVGS